MAQALLPTRTAVCVRQPQTAIRLFGVSSRQALRAGQKPIGLGLGRTSPLIARRESVVLREVRSSLWPMMWVGCLGRIGSTMHVGAVLWLLTRFCCWLCHLCMYGLCIYTLSAAQAQPWVPLQAVATEIVEAEAVAAAQNGNGKLHSNGNGAPYSNGNGTSLNGNGNGHGTSEIKVIIDPSASVTAVATSTNGNGNGNGASSNGNGKTTTAAVAYASIANGTATAAAAAATQTERMRLLNTIDEEQNAEAAGQLELAAATAKERKARSAAGTPYKAPGGTWSKFKTYSVWQVRGFPFKRTLAWTSVHHGDWLHASCMGHVRPFCTAWAAIHPFHAPGNIHQPVVELCLLHQASGISAALCVQFLTVMVSTQGSNICSKPWASTLYLRSSRTAVS